MVENVEPVASNCANWSIAPPFEIIGECQRCGVPWQSYGVAYDYRCPHFVAARLTQSTEDHRG